MDATIRKALSCKRNDRTVQNTLTFIGLTLLLSLSKNNGGQVHAAATLGPNSRPSTTRPTPSTEGPRGNNVRPTAAPYYTIWSYPNPQSQPLYCRPKENSRVSYFCDPNTLVRLEEAREMDNAIRQIRDGTKGKTFCKFGTIFAVAVIPKIITQADKPQSMEEQMRYFADELRTQNWKFDDCQNEVLLAVARDQKGAWLSVGPPLTKMINASSVQRLSAKATDLSRLREVTYEAARLLGVKIAPLKPGYNNDINSGPAQQSANSLSTWTIVAVIACVVGFIAVISLAATLGSYCGRKCGHDHSSKDQMGEVHAYSEEEPKQTNRAERKAWFSRLKRNRGKESVRSEGGMYQDVDEEEEHPEPYYNDSRASSGHHHNNRNSSNYGNRNSYGNNRNSYDNNRNSMGSGSNRPPSYPGNNNRLSNGSYEERRSERSGGEYGDSRLNF